MNADIILYVTKSGLCVTTGTRHLDRLSLLGEFEQDSNTDSESPRVWHHAGVDADIIIYVTTTDPEECGNTLASAAACAFDSATNRPVAGNIIFCQFGPNQYDKDLATAVHELFHILVCTLLQLSLIHISEPTRPY